METLQPLATESFSYSWLSDHKPSLGGLDDPPRASNDSYYGGTSKEFDYEMLESSSVTDQNFNFDALGQTPAAFIHADELFNNGFIRPIYIDTSKREESCNTLGSIHTRPTSSSSSRAEIPTGRVHCSFVGRWRKSTQQILRNLYGHLRPFCRKLGLSRKSTRVDDIDGRMSKVKSRNSSLQASPQQNTASKIASCHLENSIYEAVLHCKRSIGIL